jgi:fucose permease
VRSPAGALAGAGVGAPGHLVATSAAGAVAVAWARGHLWAPRAGRPEERGTHGSHARARRGSAGAGPLVTPVLLVCGLIAFCAAVGEGAMADWSALYLTDTLDADAGLAAMGYAAFAGAMALGRFAGERVIRALGAAGTLQLGCGAAAIALTAGLAAADGPATIAAFAVAGLGVACVFPVVLSTAGRAEPGRSGPAVALVSTIGYTGFLAGPPVIGLVAERTTLAWGLGTVALLAAVAAALAVGLREWGQTRCVARSPPAVSARATGVQRNGSDPTTRAARR